MFGKTWNEALKDQHPAPEWAADLCRRLAPAGWRIYWRTFPNGRPTVCGCAWGSRKVIQIYASNTEQTARALHVVLHEIAHALHPEREVWRGRMSAHGPGFARAACKLYAMFPGQMEHAAESSSYAAEKREARKRCGLPVKALPRRRVLAKVKQYTVTVAGRDYLTQGKSGKDALRKFLAHYSKLNERTAPQFQTDLSGPHKVRLRRTPVAANG